MMSGPVIPNRSPHRVERGSLRRRIRMPRRPNSLKEAFGTGFFVFIACACAVLLAPVIISLRIAAGAAYDSVVNWLAVAFLAMVILTLVLAVIHRLYVRAEALHEIADWKPEESQEHVWRAMVAADRSRLALDARTRSQLQSLQGLVLQMRELFEEQIAAHQHDSTRWSATLGSSEVVDRLALCRRLEAALAPLQDRFSAASSLQSLSATYVWSADGLASALSETTERLTRDSRKLRVDRFHSSS
jgi:hypothetical protein